MFVVFYVSEDINGDPFKAFLVCYRDLLQQRKLLQIDGYYIIKQVIFRVSNVMVSTGKMMFHKD